MYSKALLNIGPLGRNVSQPFNHQVIGQYTSAFYTILLRIILQFRENALNVWF